MKTTAQILQEIRQVKTCSLGQLYRYFETLNIEPIGARQRPQRYPDDSVHRILAHLGFSDTPAVTRPGGVTPAASQSRIPSMRELRAERARAQKAHGKGVSAR